MADNEVTGTGKAVCTDKVTYSGDTDQNVQLVRFVQVTGSEGSRTVVNLPGDATDGLLVNLGANNDITGTVTANIGSPTSGGPTTHHKVSAATTNATNVKASAGQLFGWYIYNNNASARKVAFHNTAGTPTAGASIYFSLVIPPNSGANAFIPQGIPFGTGIGYTMVTGVADANSTAVAADDLIMNIWYA